MDGEVARRAAREWMEGAIERGKCQRNIPVFGNGMIGLPFPLLVFVFAIFIYGVILLLRDKGFQEKREHHGQAKRRRKSCFIDNIF